MRQAALALALLIGSLGAASPLPAADDPDPYGDGYADGNYGRVRYLENGATILRGATVDAENFASGAAVANTPVFPGDTLRTGRDQRAEVQLPSGTVLRLDRDGEIVFQALPRPGAAYRDNTVLSMGVGTLRVASRAAEDDEFRIDTPSGSVYPLDSADLRIEVDRSGVTRVFSHRGVAEVVGEGGSVLVRGGMRTKVEPGFVPSEPRAFNTLAGDGFDEWCDARDDVYRRGTSVAASGGAYDALPPEVQPYYGELSAYGTWTSVPSYGWVWSPSGVAASWRPYYDGYWDYGPGGYFWIGSEPWGWAPYHYGRWSVVAGYGWCWIPGTVFGGAWVSWSWGSAYVGWAPLDYWNYPAYYGPVYMDYDPHCWTFVGYDHLGHGRPYPHYAVPADSIRPSQRGAIVTRPPRVSPREASTSADARQRAVRELGQDPRARFDRSRLDRKPETRFVETERRALTRSGRDASAGGGRRDGGRTSDPGPNRAARPDRTERRAPVAEPTGRATPTDPRRLGGSDRDGSEGRPTPLPGRKDASRSGAGEREPSSGFPRRYERDPRADERRDRGASEPVLRAPAERPQDARERLRDMYDRLASPRETRPRTEGRDLRPAPQAPRVEPPRATAPQPRAPQAPPRATAPQPRAPQAPRVEPPRASPRPEARPQPQREQPKRQEGSHGSAEKAHRK